MRVIGLDHVVLLCRDIEASLRYYENEIGLGTIDADKWRNGRAFFPSVRVNEHTIIDLLEGEPAGRNDRLDRTSV